MFTEIEFTSEYTAPLGLAPKRLRDLKPLVVLAGPNGAGKSRYLRLIESIWTRVQETRGVVSGLQERVKQLEALDQQNRGPIKSIFYKEEELEKAKDDLARLQRHLGLVELAPGAPSKFNVIPLAYGLNQPDNPEVLSPAKFRDVVESNRSGGFYWARESIHAYFYEVARAIHDAEHPRTKDHPDIQKGLADAQSFNQILNALLSARIQPTLGKHRSVIPLFRDRPFRPDELSAGELILVTWAILLNRQKEWLQGACVLLDEPENHLHPDVCIRALSALQNEILGPHGQLILSTHSIPLVAHAGMESVYFVDGGTIDYGGNKIEKIIDRLMGSQDGRAKLRAFISDAEEIAFEVFAAQSLLPPDVAGAREKDPQQAQMVDIASTVGAHKENVRILDFAAGRGRLAAALKQAGLAANRKFTYYAFNDARFSKKEDLLECLQHIRQLEQPLPPESYLVDGIYKLTGPDSEPMDLVVMCNVLHEMPVDDWQRCFSEIVDVLAEDGKLVILEDQLPHVGELPHENGYVILDEFALKALFHSRDKVTALHTEPNARLTAFAITKAALRQVTPTTLGSALGKVMRRAREEIRRIRAVSMNDRTYQLGRKHAHFTMLYANAQLAMEKYPEKVGAGDEHRA